MHLMGASPGFRELRQQLVGFAVALVAHPLEPAMTKVAVRCIVTCQEYNSTIQIYFGYRAQLYGTLHIRFCCPAARFSSSRTHR
jgi:hypothetical protein